MTPLLWLVLDIVCPLLARIASCEGVRTPVALDIKIGTFANKFVAPIALVKKLPVALIMGNWFVQRWHC